MWIWKYVILELSVVMLTGTAQEVRTSRACYGAPGLKCTQHQYNCGSNRIAIVDAHYTNNNICQQGLSNCVIDIRNTKEGGRSHGFNQTELTSLCKNCSANTNCSYRPNRRGDNITFSVIQYKCIEGEHDLTISCPADDTTMKTPSDGNNSGAIVGGVLSTILILVVLSLLILWIIQRRKLRSTSQLEAGVGKQKGHYLDTQHNYHELEDMKNPSTDSHYDYVTLPEPKEEDYDHIGDTHTTVTGQYDTTASAAKEVEVHKISSSEEEVDYSYDHLEEGQTKGSDVILSGAYDTAASVSDSLQEFRNEHISDVDYGHNHVGDNTKINHHNNDYDTADSASKRVVETVKEIGNN